MVHLLVITWLGKRAVKDHILYSGVTLDLFTRPVSVPLGISFYPLPQIQRVCFALFVMLHLFGVSVFHLKSVILVKLLLLKTTLRCCSSIVEHKIECKSRMLQGS